MSTRLPAEQTSPWLMKTPKSAPSTAASKSASAKKMLGDLPPSSRLTFFRVSAAERMMTLPTSTLPVKAILSTSSWATSGAPAVSPKPVTTFTTPLGRPQSSKKRANSRSVSGVCSAGLMTDGAARADRGGELPGGHQQRVVPGDDLPRHPQGLAQGQGDRVVGDVQDLAVDLGGEPAVVLEAGGDVAEVELRLHDRLAGVPGLELGEPRQLVAHLLGEAEEDPPPLLRGDLAPARRRRARRLDRPVHVGGARVRDTSR